MVLAAFFFAAPASASASAQEQVGGKFYADCWIADGAAVTILLENNIRMNLAGSPVRPDDAYRTKEQVFEGESQTMQVSLCDDKMDNCRDIEGVLSTYAVSGESIEGNLEYFDGTETQGDAESLQGHMAQFTATPDKDRPAPRCL